VEPPYNADIVVTGGDDMDPDPKQRAAEIAEQFEEHFHGTLGVMQPTGDIASSPNCDMICGSPWLGAEWIRRAYRGSGPLWPEYNHFFGDEELQAVAVRHGLLWQRSDLCQHHDHWLVQGGPPKTSYQHHMDTWWPHDETIFRWRKRQAFPGSELLDTPMTATIPEPTR
jgi:hypothetical protein